MGVKNSDGLIWLVIFAISVLHIWIVTFTNLVALAWIVKFAIMLVDFVDTGKVHILSVLLLV